VPSSHLLIHRLEEGPWLIISSFVGIIMIIGIVAENAILIIHKLKGLQAGGMQLNDALLAACLMSTRPIAMTALAAILALLLLSLGIGAGGQLQQPLAIAVIGGFSLSSVLLFVRLPMVYRLIRSQ
jgi:cobalt-zinc-cadmium resistance protein CzcA